MHIPAVSGTNSARVVESVPQALPGTVPEALAGTVSGRLVENALRRNTDATVTEGTLTHVMRLMLREYDSPKCDFHSFAATRTSKLNVNNQMKKPFNALVGQC